ncbi:MAG: YibE/F family protein [Acidimicrobiia bacterium]
MNDSPDQLHPDLARLAGPDRRWRPSPGNRGPAALAASLAVLTLLGMILLRPTGTLDVDLVALGVTGEVHRASVEAVEEVPCAHTDPDDRVACQRVTFRLLEGPVPGSIAVQEFPDLPSAPRFTEGEEVVLNYLVDAPTDLQYQFADRERRSVLLWVGLAFGVAVVALGRWRGLAALGGLAASVLVLISFVIPAILAGRSPILVAAVGAAAIGFLALYLAHGVNPLTHVALLGTIASLALTVGLSALVVEVASLSGFATEESLYLTLLPGQIDIRGLILAGIVLGALGALDDVTVTQASAIWELRAANPSLDRSKLAAAGLRVGRDHIASTVNTLLLAYAGASMPLLLLFTLSGQPLGVVANSEVIAVEIIRTLVGSIGLVASVPITTWLAVRSVVRLPPGALGRAGR